MRLPSHHNSIVPAATMGSRWDDVCKHRQAVALWFLLNVLDFALTQAGLSQGGYELNWFLRDLSPSAFALQKFLLTMAATTWLATCRWLWFLKWLNLAFIVLVGLNIYQLVTLLLN